DRQEEISSESIGALDALRQCLPRGTLGDQEYAAFEPGGKQLLLDALGEIQIEGELQETARACGARRLRRVSDIDHGPECLVLASIGGPGFGARLMRSGTGDCSRNEHPHDA